MLEAVVYEQTGVCLAFLDAYVCTGGICHFTRVFAYKCVLSGWMEVRLLMIVCFDLRTKFSNFYHYSFDFGFSVLYGYSHQSTHRDECGHCDRCDACSVR